jgi:hypothetical protein
VRNVGDNQNCWDVDEDRNRYSNKLKRKSIEGKKLIVGQKLIDLTNEISVMKKQRDQLISYLPKEIQEEYFATIEKWNGLEQKRQWYHECLYSLERGIDKDIEEVYVPLEEKNDVEFAMLLKYKDRTTCKLESDEVMASMENIDLLNLIKEFIEGNHAVKFRDTTVSFNNLYSIEFLIRKQRRESE